MIIAAFCVSFLIAISGSLLCAKLEKRRINYKDYIIGVILFLCVIFLQYCIYSNPGINRNFGRFRFVAITAFTLWASICLLAFRMRSYMHGNIIKLALALFFSLGIETFICNMPFFATYSYEPYDLSPITSNDGVIIIRSDEDNLELTFKNIKRPIYNLQFVDLTYNSDSGSYNDNNKAISVSISVTDNAYHIQKKLSHTNWYVSNLAESSQIISTWFNGDVDSLILNISTINNAPIDYSVKAIKANVRRPFQISLVRLFLLTIFILAIIEFRPSSSLWHEVYLDNIKKFRPAVIASILLLIMLSIVIPQANPSLNGFATKDWNSDKWDKEESYNFFASAHSCMEYSELAHGLISGNFYTNEEPDLELLDTAYPYDTDFLNQSKIPYKWDHALYNGHYYVYFGIVPCLLFQVPYETITGREGLPSWVDIVGMGIVFSLLIFPLMKQILKRWFPYASAASYFLCCWGLVFGTQFINLLCRPDIYETAILSGSVFLLLGLWQWLVAANTPTDPTHKKQILFHLAIGSLSIALVAGCRPQMELFAFMCIPIFWKRYITEKRLFSKDGIIESAAFALPVVLVAIALVYYNVVRFGSPIEFGSSYNLTSNDIQQRGFNPWRICSSLYAYFLQIPSGSAVFPYLKTVSAETNLIGTHSVESMQGGLFICIPFTWFIIAIPALKEKLHAKDNGLMAVIIFSILVSIGLAIIDGQMGGIYRRYLMDFSPVFLLSACLCILTLEEAYINSSHCAATYLKTSIFFAVVLTLIYRFCTLFSTVDANYITNNPALYAYISRLVQFWL